MSGLIWQCRHLPVCCIKSSYVGSLPRSFHAWGASILHPPERGLCAAIPAGFAWLTYNPKDGSLAVESTPNQDNPMSSSLGYSGNTPILGLDVVSWVACCSCPCCIHVTHGLLGSSAGLYHDQS